jgi:hypothetical protein
MSATCDQSGGIGRAPGAGSKGSPAALPSPTTKIFGDLPEHIPLCVAELQVIESYLATVLEELFKLAAPHK